MTESTGVDYAEVGNDFAFFIRHTNESRAQVTALLPAMSALVDGCGQGRMLDFGCGDGTFGLRLLEALGASASRIGLTLAEPVGDHLDRAVGRLAPLVKSIAVTNSDLEQSGIGPFDLILANHCLYYVADPSETVGRLLDLLAPGGVLIAPMLDRGNALARIWQTAFDIVDQPFPFVLAEDIEALARFLGADVSREVIAYTIDFPDRPAARLSILRFLLGDYLKALDAHTARSLFDAHTQGDRVVLATTYPHLVIRQCRSEA
jgi:SAM-dependent methyltransferase